MPPRLTTSCASPPATVRFRSWSTCTALPAAIIGNSLGGVTTLQGTAEGKINARCLVLNAPASFQFVGLRGRPAPGVPLSDDDIDRKAALRRIEPINVPVLFILGTADGLTPINLKLVDLMQAADKDVRLELFPDQGHAFTNGPDSPAFHRAVSQSLEFIQAHLAADDA